jgi:hypothetical protein
VLLVTRARLDRAAALSVLAMDQLLVGAAKLCVLALAARVAPLARVDDEGRARTARDPAAARRSARPRRMAPHGRRGARGECFRRDSPSRSACSLRALEPLRPRPRPARFGLALLKKAVEVAAIVCVQRAFGLPVPIAAAIVVLAVLNLATLLPIVPGTSACSKRPWCSRSRGSASPRSRHSASRVVQHLCYFVALACPARCSQRGIADADVDAQRARRRAAPASA